MRFQNGLIAQRQVNSHLVAVEVCVECRTGEGMQLDGFAFNQLRLEGLYTEAMQCRSAVQQHRMPFHHILQNIPYYRLLAVDNFLCRFHGLHNAAFYQLANDKGLIQLGGHLFRQATFVHFQFRPDNNHRPRGVVHPFTQQILPKTSLFALQTVGE